MTDSEIDAEVRSLFAEDGRLFLARMEAASVLLAEAPVLAPRAFQSLGAQRGFETIEDGAQSIRGSASSVDAHFLAEAALGVEELSRRGGRALEIAATHAKRAHAIAAFCRDAMREMSAMLTLYTEDAPEEAEWLAMALRERSAELRKDDDEALLRLENLGNLGGESAAAEHVHTSPTDVPEPDVHPPVDDHRQAETTSHPAEEFAFTEVAEAPPLAQVFQEEARQVLLAAKGHVEQFLDKREFAALTAIEPLLHTLVGSAASVALPYLSSQAGEALSALTSLRHSMGEDSVLGFLRAINRLLATVSIPIVDPAHAAHAAQAAHGAHGADGTHSKYPGARLELPEVFASEAQRVIESAAAVARKLSDPSLPKEVVAALSSDAAKLFHRLKGTALVVGAKMIADEADAVMVACRNLSDAATLATALLDACGRLRGLVPPTASATAFSEPALPVVHGRRISLMPSEPPNFISDGLLAIFREEISALLDPLNAALDRLDGSPRDPVGLEAAQRLFHTLKGTAAAVGQLTMSADAARLELLVDEALEDPRRIDGKFVGTLREGARAVLAVLGLGDAITDALEELSSEELEEADDSFASLPSTPAADSASSPLLDADAAPMPPAEWDDLVAHCAIVIAAAVEAPPASDALVDELALIFIEEVEQLAPAIAEAFQQLVLDPKNLSATRALERFLHTLKGSAATVNRRELSISAESLRGALEAVVQGVELTPARVLALKAASEQLIALATRRSSGSLAPSDAALPFAFDDDDAVAELDGRKNNELFDIFQREAREALIALQGHLETLTATPSSVYAAEYIGQLFHTLKGAAATVGLADVANQAAALHATMEEILASKRTPDPLFIEELVANTNGLLQSIGIPPIVVRRADDVAGKSTGGSHDDSADDIERRIFTGEVKGICRQASARVRELLAAKDASETLQLRADIADLFHRLKGTAATVGAHAIAEEAGRATEVARGKGPSREVADLVRAAIVRIADLAGFERAPARHQRDASGVQREQVTVPDDGELWESFNQECSELLDGLDRAVLSLEEVAQPKQVVDEIFRLVHTLKGAVNTVGLSATGKVLHITEDFLEDLTKAPIMPPMRTVAGILIDVAKQVRANLGSARTGWVETSPGAFTARTAAAMRPASSAIEEQPHRSGALATGSLKSIFDSAMLFGTAAIGHGAQPSNSNSNSNSNGSASSDRDASGADTGAAAGERAYIRVATTRLDTLMNLAGELVVSRSRMANRVGTLRLLYGELGRSRVRLSDTVETFRDQYEFANIDGKVGMASSRSAVAPPSLMADSRPLDLHRRADASPLFGELELDEYGDIHVLSRSLAEIGNDFEEAFRTLSSELSSFADDAESLGGIISGIQGEVTRARMVPLDAVFARLRLPVRDAATRDGKDVRVVTEGAEVNIDKTIADAILQPLLHLVRNSVAHGIESPARRASQGKDRCGTVRLVARQQSGQIVIEVADDGAGLDLTALRARGVAQGLLPADISADDPRVKELVFASGVSTRDVANDIAGRGIGGSVVKRTIERLNGAIRIETVRGKRTSFVITLPVTLAITRALLVSEGGATYAVPLYFAERILDSESYTVVETGNERRIMLDGLFTRARRLGDYFGMPGTSAPAPGGGPALVLRVGDERMVLQLDAVIGQEEIVVKRAGELLEGHPLFAGVTLRGTGDLVLIVDVPGLLGESARVRPTDDVAGPTRSVPPGPDSTSLLSAGPESSLAKAEVSLPKASPPKKGLPKAAKAAGSPAPPIAAAPQPITGVRALVIDDSLSVRKVAEAHLRGLGVAVVVAVDGVDGLAKLREGRFDIVFTDLEMPRMHGYDFVRQVRMLAAYHELPVVVVSSRSGQKHQDHARAVGATDYITKPFSSQLLGATIRKWLRR